MRRRVHRGRKGGIIGGKSVETYGVPITGGVADPGPASMEVYWHPNRPGVEPCPEDFAQKLRDANGDLACCRPPAGAPIGKAPAWIIWYRRGRVTHRLCPGWLLLFVWRNDRDEPEPLDERIFAVLYASSAFKWGDGQKYFDRALTQVEADRKAIREKDFQNERKAKQRELLASHRISNLGDGSRSALHHDGSVVPSPGELAWREQRRRRMMPSEMLKAEDEARDRARALDADYDKNKVN